MMYIITLMTLDNGGDGIFLIMGNAGFISSIVGFRAHLQTGARLLFRAPLRIL